MKHLWRALADASASIPALAEDGRAEYGGGGYDYISAPGAIRTIKPALLEVGLLPAVTGTTVIEVCGKLAVQLHCRLIHLESGEELEDRFTMPISPGRGRPEDKACQASITSGLGRWLRCLLLAVQAGEAEIDTSSGSTAARAPEELQPAGVAPEDLAPRHPPDTPEIERALATLAESINVSADDAAMWGTRIKTKGPDGKPRNSAQLGTMLAAIKQGKARAAVVRIYEDIATAEAKGMSPGEFGAKVITPWAKDQIPY